ncbi:ABC transporter ATP-binding protein [soil metagenome]
MIGSFHALIRDAYAVAGWRLPLLVAVTFFSALLEGATIAALLPLLAKSAGSQGEASDIVSRFLEAVLSALGLPSTTTGVAILVAILIFFSAVVFLYQAHLSSRLQTDYVASWQKRLFSVFFSADYGFFRSRRAGDLIASAVSEPQRLGGAFYQANLIVTSILYIAVQVAIALLIAPIVVALLVGVGCLLFVATRGLVRRALGYGRDMTAVNADFQADAGELMMGAKFVKATSTEVRAVDRLGSAIERLRQLTFANSFDVQIVRAVFEYASGLLVVVLLAAGPKLFAVDVGTVLVVVAMFVRLFPKVTGLRQCLQSIGLALPAFDAVSGTWAEANAAREIGGLEVPSGWHGTGPAKISLAHVSVEANARAILSDVSLEIPAGAFVVIVGPTGAGKTTLLDCILGLRRPTQGTVAIDDLALDNLPAPLWRKGVGYLGQDPVLFNASIADNLRWIMPQTTDDELRAALAKASADFVGRLPEGIQTMVGDHGSRLSGGERQRLALARALLGNPRLLVLDEATSALDAATEESVVASIRSLKGEITIVAITHRPALVDAADFMIEMEEGRVTSFAPTNGAATRGTGSQAVRIPQ